MTDEERAAATRLGVFLSLTSYGLLLCCVLAWLLYSPLSLDQAGLRTGEGWNSDVLRGGFIGMAWAGFWLFVWLVLPAPQRFRREVPGLGASFVKQVAVWLAGAFAEELWRVVCIAALLGAGYSPSSSAIGCALAYAVAFSTRGTKRFLLAALEGAIFGGLFLWHGYFVAPFTAHLVVQAVYLWGLGHPRMDLAPGKTTKRTGINCPACGALLSRLQVKIKEGFTCPSCGVRLSVSEGYRTTIRWVVLAAYIGSIGYAIHLFSQEIVEDVGIWLVILAAFGVAISAQIVIQGIFPPTLECGDPHFIALDLGNHHPTDSTDSEDH